MARPEAVFSASAGAAATSGGAGIGSFAAGAWWLTARRKRHCTPGDRQCKSAQSVSDASIQCTEVAQARTWPMPGATVIMRHTMPGLFPQRADARELVLSPQENLVAGGPAEQLEQLIQSSFKQGIQRVFVDLRAVPLVDSAGIRALVRGHTSAERLGRQFSPRRAEPSRARALRLSRLDQVFTVSDSVSIARARPIPWARIFDGRRRGGRRRRARRRRLSAARRPAPRAGPQRDSRRLARGQRSRLAVAAARTRQARGRGRRSACWSRSSSGTIAPIARRIPRWSRRRSCCASPAP